MKYLERITRPSDSYVENDTALANDNAQLECEQSVLTQQKSINSLKGQIETAKSANPLVPATIIDLQIKLQIADKKKDLIKKLQKELF